MSAATLPKDKADQKPAAPMGSFLAKLQPPPKPTAAKAEEAKPDDARPAANAPVAPDATPPAAVPAEPKADAAPDAAAKPDEKAKDSEKDTLEKRLKDTQSWANEEHKLRLKADKNVQELQEKLDRIEKKLDGTYEEPKTPSPDQLIYDAEMRGKIRASHRAAVRKHGEEFVMKTIWAPDSPYMTLQASNPLIGQRVLASDDPVQEALDVLQEEEDAKKYGRTSEEMRKKIEAELKPKITQEVLDGLKPKPGPATATLGNVRGDGERSAPKADVPATLDFKRVFPHGASRA